jgi:uncharacterized protein (DUF58 family)
MDNGEREGVGVTLGFYSLILTASILLGLYIYSLASFPWALDMASAILGMALASYFYVKASWNALGMLKIERIIEGEVVEGASVKVSLKVENSSLVPLVYMEIADSPPRLFRVVGNPRKILMLPPRSSATYYYEVAPIPGRHKFGPLWLTVRDPLGLTIASFKVEVEPREIHVMPLVKETPMLRRLAASLPYMGVMSRRRGWGTAFYYLREYTEDDDYRRIDWKSYARTGRLLVKVFEAEEALRVALVVILSKGMLYGPYGNSMFEIALRAAASLAYFHLLKGDVVELYIYDGEGVVLASKPLWGRLAAPNAWRLLASASPPDGEAPDTEEALRFIERILPPMMKSSGYYLILITAIDKLAEELSRHEAPALLEKVVGGAFIHLYPPLFSIERIPEWNLEQVISYKKAVMDISERLSPLLERIGFSYIVLGPELSLSSLLRGLRLHAPR